ncbi:acyltransferase family protein [Aquicoccus sp. SCR17]|nr:acyltransferase family protein [Carideicomes alvinocaridis]
MSVRTASGASKLLYLDSLRGLSALVVAVHHFQVNSPLSSSLLVANAWVFLDFFFVLSGFVIALNYEDGLRTWRGIASFQFGRFLRIYPLHLVMLMVFVGIGLVKLIASHELGLHLGTPAFEGDSLAAFLHNLALTQNLAMDELSFNKPSWTLSAEFWTYVIFAGIIFLCGANRRLRLGLCWAVVAISFVWLAGHDMGASESPVRCLHGFFLGALTCTIARRLPKLGAGLPLTLVFALFLYALAVHDWNRTGLEAMAFPYLFAGLILLFEATREDVALRRALEHPWLVHLGVISLGVYLIHSAVWWVMQNVARLSGISMAYLYDEAQPVHALESPWVVSALLLSGLAITIGLAHLSYARMERPVMRARRRLDPFSAEARGPKAAATAEALGRGEAQPDARIG